MILAIGAVTQPFLSGVPVAAFLFAVVLVLGGVFWRSAAALQGHVRAGAQVIVEALARQGAPAAGGARLRDGADALGAVRLLLPGIGEPTAVRLREGGPAIGRSLSELGVRGKTGATVLAIVRSSGNVMVPSAGEVLCAGDVVALAGTREAVESARELLGGEAKD